MRNAPCSFVDHARAPAFPLSDIHRRHWTHFVWWTSFSTVFLKHTEHTSFHNGILWYMLFRKMFYVLRVVSGYTHSTQVLKNKRYYMLPEWDARWNRAHLTIERDVRDRQKLQSQANEHVLGFGYEEPDSENISSILYTYICIAFTYILICERYAAVRPPT